MERPGVGIGVIILKESQVLLGKRKGSHGAGTWCFPGGHLEKYESFPDCAKRETREETGLEIDLIDHSPHTATNDFFRKDNKHYVTLYLRARYLGGEPRVTELDKCEEWRWFYWQQLQEKEVSLFTPVKNLIKQHYNPFYPNASLKT